MRRAEKTGMTKTTISPMLRYGIAIVSVALALIITQLLQPLAEASIYSLSFFAVIITAWYAGLGPGLLATALAGLAIDYLFIGSPRSLEFDLRHFEQVGVFMVVAILIGYLTAARKRAEEDLREAHADLEVRVQKRTQELAQTNEDLQAEITERKEAEMRLAELARELEERNRELLRLQGEVGRVERLAAMGKIAGTIAHELGTPLNSVLGYTQLIAQEPLPESAERRLKIVKDQVERMVNIIAQYLSRSRGSFQKRATVNVNELIAETLELLKPIFQQHDLRVEARLARPLPSFSGDEASLQRVLINLLDNAVDATEPGGTITVATAAASLPRSTQRGVSITVQDTGAGIAPDLLPRIFEFFVTTKAPGHGTGLGLAFCQEIVKGHGGTIEIDSRVGEGTAVRVFIPVEEAAAERPPAEGPA